MAQKPQLTIANRWFAQLNAGVTSGATSWILKSSGATGITAPCFIHANGEIVKVTAIAADTPSSGLDTLTVTRAQDGTTATTHSANDYVGLFFYRAAFAELMGRIATLEQLLNSVVGNTTGIQRPPTDALAVTAESSPSMTVEIAPGAGVSSGQPIALASMATLTFVAPSTNPRIDIIEIDQDGTVSAVTGTEAASPSAPSVTTDSIKLAEVYHRTAETSIKDTNDSTNGYITDSRSGQYL